MADDDRDHGVAEGEHAVRNEDGDGIFQIGRELAAAGAEEVADAEADVLVNDKDIDADDGRFDHAGDQRAECGTRDLHFGRTEVAEDEDPVEKDVDEEADDFEYQIIGLVQKLLAFAGVDEDKATPIFKRGRVSNQKEITEMILSASQYLDDEAVLSYLPFITVDEKDDILKRKAEMDMSRFADKTTEEETEDVVE